MYCWHGVRRRSLNRRRLARVHHTLLTARDFLLPEYANVSVRPKSLCCRYIHGQIDHYFAHTLLYCGVKQLAAQVLHCTVAAHFLTVLRCAVLHCTVLL